MKEGYGPLFMIIIPCTVSDFHSNLCKFTKISKLAGVGLLHQGLITAKLPAAVLAALQIFRLPGPLQKQRPSMPKNRRHTVSCAACLCSVSLPATDSASSAPALLAGDIPVQVRHLPLGGGQKLLELILKVQIAGGRGIRCLHGRTMLGRGREMSGAGRTAARAAPAREAPF